MADIKYSAEQTAIFSEFEHPDGNVVIQAFAGCAKTTSVVKGVDYAPEKRILMCAFGTLNADELKVKVKNPNAECRTLHSLGRGVISSRGRRIEVDKNRGRKLAIKAIGRREHTGEAVALTSKLASLGKNTAPFAEVAELERLAVEFELEPKNDELGEEERPWTVADIAACAHEAMDLATDYDGTIDFDDMVYLPVRMKWARPQYDLVVVDEYQDMNPVQLMLARAMCAGRIVLVGDEFQAIYEFRGANADFARTMVKELKAKVMTLSTTFRCPQAVVAVAQELVPGYKAAPEAPKGTVRGIAYDKLFGDALPGDFILSRKNAPLAKICLALLRTGKRALIRGRKIGEGLVTVIKQRQARSIPELLTILGEWEKNTVEGLIAQDASETRIEHIRDQAETIRFLAEGLVGVNELVERLNNLFDDATPGNTIICSSVHRAKGLEAERVFLLVDTLYPGKRHDEEERNIHYVAVTRSKRELVMVKGKPGEG